MPPSNAETEMHLKRLILFNRSMILKQKVLCDNHGDEKDSLKRILALCPQDKNIPLFKRKKMKVMNFLHSENMLKLSSRFRLCFFPNSST